MFYAGCACRRDMRLIREAYRDHCSPKRTMIMEICFLLISGLVLIVSAVTWALACPSAWITQYPSFSLHVVPWCPLTILVFCTIWFITLVCACRVNDRCKSHSGFDELENDS
jgi:hypothetical protein